MKRYLLAIITVFCLSLLPLSTALAAKSFKVKIKLPSSGIDQVNAIASNGRVFAGTKNGSTIKISIPNASLRGASFYAVDGGRLLGPVISPKGSKALIFLAKKITNAEGKTLNSLSLKLNSPESGKNYVRLSKAPKGKVFDKSLKYDPASIPAYGLNAPNQSNSRALVRISAARGDSDGDGVVDKLDTDADGDGINNIADQNTELVTNRFSAAVVGDIDIPYTSMYLDIDRTINWHVSGALTSTEIDEAIGGENVFAIAFFFGKPPGDTSGVTGGHVICGSNLRYCRPTVGSETGTGVYSGFSEGNSSLLGQLWSDIKTDGSEYSLESFNVGGQNEPVFAASIQPRVGTEFFRPGDNYRVDFTNSSGDVLTSSTLTLPPYFLTVPAVRSYNTSSNDASADVLLDYSDSNALGRNTGNPIVLASSGDFSGKLRLNIWRLQRLAIGSESSNGYMDYGHLNYGITINNNSGEFSCGELYSSLSSTLTELSSRGQNDSFRSSDGALLWPLVDSADDYEPSSASDSTTVGNNTLSFTIDLSACRVRNGLAAGVYNINILAAGVDTGHGSNRAGQMIAVNIP